MKRELNKKIISICEEAGSTAAKEKCAELMDEIDREYDSRVESGMTELEAYRDVLGRLEEIERLVASLPKDGTPKRNTDADRDAGHKTLKRILESVNSVMWVAVIIGYLLVSLITGKWKYTWLIFLCAAAANVITDAVRDVNDSKKDRKKVEHDGKEAVLWIMTTAAYFALSMATGHWLISALVFVAVGIVSKFIK